MVRNLAAAGLATVCATPGATCAHAHLLACDGQHELAVEYVERLGVAIVHMDRRRVAAF